MIQRVVLIKLTEAHSEPATIDKVAQRSREVLPTVAGVRRVTVGQPVGDKSRKDWDLCLTVEFDLMDDVAPYIADPVHRAYVDDFLKPRLLVIKAWNFDIGGA